MLLRSSEKNLDSNKPFEIEFTDECIEEMLDIYEYISNHLKENNIAKRLMTEVIDKILEIEATNIFALNLNAILWERKMLCKKSEDCENITEYYTVLRQAALKKRFFLISRKLDEYFQKRI